MDGYKFGYVVIDKEEYKELVEKAERIDTLERMFAESSILAKREIEAILGIEVKKGDTESGSL
jgi:phage pi2 protein 07